MKTTAAPANGTAIQKKDAADPVKLAKKSTISNLEAGDDVSIRVAGTRPDFRLYGRIKGFETRDGIELAVFEGDSGGFWLHPTANCDQHEAWAQEKRNDLAYAQTAPVAGTQKVGR